MAAARAMIAGEIDGFWANGMAAAVAVDSGAGTIVMDVRRGEGPRQAFGFTQPTLAARDDWLRADPSRAVAARALTNAINAGSSNSGVTWRSALGTTRMSIGGAVA